MRLYWVVAGFRTTFLAHPDNPHLALSHCPSLTQKENGRTRRGKLNMKQNYIQPIKQNKAFRAPRTVLQHCPLLRQTAEHLRRALQLLKQPAKGCQCWLSGRLKSLKARGEALFLHQRLSGLGSGNGAVVGRPLVGAVPCC